MISDATALELFAVGNALRIAAYLPQLIRILRDPQGACAVSCWTWGMFTLANLSTVIYAETVLHDRHVTLVFMLNVICCAAIVLATALRRRRHRRTAMLSPSRG